MLRMHSQFNKVVYFKKWIIFKHLHMKNFYVTENFQRKKISLNFILITIKRSLTTDLTNQF